MQCPNCAYVLTYSDRLLCRVGCSRYCPCCWSRIDGEGVSAGMTVRSEMSEDREPLSGDQKVTRSLDDDDEEGRFCRLASIGNGVRRINLADRQ